MLPKRTQASKASPAFTFSPTKPRETEIVVQKPPTGPPKPKPASSTAGDTETNVGNNNSTTNERSHSEAERLILGTLQQLQTIYNDACKTHTQTITIKKATFESIANGIHQAYEHLKQPCRNNKTSSTTENTILNALAQIQNSVANLETKYKDIETKIADTPKTYAEIIKTAFSKDPKIEQQTERRKQREILRQERAKYGVTLTSKTMSLNKQQSLITASAKFIAEKCQQAMNRAYINNDDAPRIIGVSKLRKNIQLQFKTEEEVITARNLSQIKEDT